MSYPDNALAAGEKVVLHRHPHWKRLILPIVVLVLVTGLAAVGSGFVESTPWQPMAKEDPLRR